MSIVFCPKCGKQISDKAPVCPHCKSPNPFMQNQQPQMQPQFQQAPTVQDQPASKHSKLVPVLLILILVIGIATATPYLIRKNKSSDSSTAETKTFTNDNPINNAIVPDDDQNKISFTEPPTQRQQRETQAATQSDMFKVKLQFTSKDQWKISGRDYDTNIYFDNEPLCTLGDGKTQTIPEFYVKKGIHTLRFEKSGDPQHFKEITVPISKDCSLSYFIKKYAGAGSKTFDISEE